MFVVDFTGCFSHCCVEGGDHWIHVCVYDGERCKLPAYHCLEGFQHIGIFQLFEVKLESCVFWLAGKGGRSSGWRFFDDDLPHWNITQITVTHKYEQNVVKILLFFGCCCYVTTALSLRRQFIAKLLKSVLSCTWSLSRDDSTQVTEC